MKTLLGLLKKDKVEPDLLIQIKEPAISSTQTDRFLAIYEGKVLIYSLFHKVVKTFYINTLNQADFNKKGIFLTFDTTNFSFQTESEEDFKSKFRKIASTMLTNLELHHPSMEPFKKFQSNPNLSSIQYRIRNRAEMQQIETVDDTIDRITRIYTYQETKISFREFKNIQDAFPLVLDVLPLCPFITSLIVFSVENFDPFAYLADFAAKNATIDTYRIEGSITPKFDKFLNSLQTNSQKILGLTFDGSHFTSPAIRSLTNCIATKSIPSICFRNAIKPDTVNIFYNYFLPGPVGNQLKFLCIDSTPSVKVSTLIAKLNALTVLSITNCGLDVPKILSALTGTHIRTLDISGNACTSSPAESCSKLPSSLVHLVANGITFANNAFLGLFEYICKYFHGPLKLSLARSETSTNEWLHFYREISNFQIKSLREIVWDSNPVHMRFFEFLSRNPKIHTLSMQGCFHESDPQPIMHLCTYIVSALALKKLIISSNENAFLGKYTASVIMAVQQSLSIEYLDINGSRCGNFGVSQLKSLLKMQNLKTLHCDGCWPSSASSYTEFIEAATQIITKRNLKFYFPQSDLNELLKIRKLRHAKFEQLKDALMSVGNGFLYHGEVPLEFAEISKNLSSIKERKNDTLSTISDDRKSLDSEEMTVKTVDPTETKKKIIKRKIKKSNLSSDDNSAHTFTTTTNIPQTMDGTRKKKIKKIIKKTKVVKKPKSEEASIAESELAKKRNTLPPPPIKTSGF
ncbi:Leucine Rich Repeat family protein [Trichomonas vaginalis G3]|uniref:Leucine Rich Repeat family protein n=1 Tax=Trichomonas vaginalis (strain ATCC PRA-98 / G3) TaxID=412133 RepID=A2GA45_TRIV3|nr:uncharacterized protein TVAGG3_0135230 [Trichomonas vaginalis G3]EAX85972.1 Leucine Rich Repeat family protein [Trichomonas vaginalis G3]KAI5546350.1 leucine-rich repeat, isoform f-related family [Trichomonas vaginalis G3]|eukprot:XP_001298902.1 hypothetical protein [Trichomonas vaginalis G3]